MWRRQALYLLLIASVSGCGRQDTEALGNIGRKLLDRAGAVSSSYRDKLGSLKSSLGSNANLQDRVALRLRWDKVLTDIPLEVVVSGQDIELKGMVKTAEQRTRAVELAEATLGVEHVVVSLTMAEEKKDE